MGFPCPQALLLNLRFRMAWEFGIGGTADRNFILSCLAGSLQNSPESSESFPNHFDSGPALDPRSKIARAILDLMLSRIIRIISESF